MLKNAKWVKTRRRFSEDFKLKVVKDYESGTYGVAELHKLYDIAVQSIYNCIYKYSKYNKKSVKVVELKDSQMEKVKQMERRIAGLECSLGQKPMNNWLSRKMINLSGEKYGIDIKKN